jgi:hypothetical protein
VASMSTAVVTVASGGLPVVELAAGKLGLPVTEAANGRGIAVTKVVGKPGLPVVFDTIGVLPPATETVWNTADLNNVTLSNGNLRATVGAGSGGVRGTNPKSSGKLYWECTYTTLNSNSFTAGISLATASVLSPSVGSSRVNRLDGVVYVNGGASGSALGIIAPASVIGIAVDLAAQLIWYRVSPAGNWNGSGTANPATGAGGVSISTISSGPLHPFFAGQSGDAATANFGASAFSGAVPAGFTSGWPA